MTRQEYQVIYAAALKTARLMIDEEVAKIKHGAYVGLTEEQVIAAVDTKIKGHIKGILYDLYEIKV